MKRRVQTACVTTGVVVAIALGAGTTASSVKAQSTPGAGPGIGARPGAGAPSRQFPGRLQPSSPVPAAEPAPTLAAPIRRAEPDDRDAPAETSDSSDASQPRQPVPPEDGVLEPAEPQPVLDGLDPSTTDTRAPEDIEAFAPREPSVGYDPAAFTIEPDPTQDRRPAQFFRFEPYDPIGIRLGSFIIFPEAEAAGAAFSNKFRSSTDVQPDTALELRPAVRAVSTWAVHALELSARSFTSFHNRFPGEDDRAYTLEARGRLDVTRRTNVEASLSRDIAQEGRGTINAASSGGDRTEIATERAGVTVNHRFNRLALQLRGAITERDFAPTTDQNGGFVSNNDRDATQREAAARATWSFRPELALFGEVGIVDRSFGAAAPSDGVRRDASGERYRAGVTFGSTSRVLRGEASIGTATQHFDDGRLATINGIIVDANLAWRLSGLTSLLFTARSDIGESTVAGSGGSLTRQAGVEVRHAFRRHLIGTAGVKIAQADFAGVNLVEQDVTATAGLEYFASREVTLFGRFSHTDFESTNANSHYTADEVRLGVRVRR